MDKGNIGGHFAAGGAYLIFAVNIIFCKDIANQAGISPIALFTLRAIGAVILFWLLSLFLSKEKVAGKDMPLIALASVVGLFLPQLTFLQAIAVTTSLDVSILSSIAPIMTMFVAAVVLKEPITFKKAFGVAMSFCGVMLLLFNTARASGGVEVSQPVGILFMVLNGLSFALYLGSFRPLISRYSVVTFMKWMFLFAMVFSLPFSARDLVHVKFNAIPMPVALEIAFLIFFATFVAYFLIPIGQKKLRPTLVSMYSYLQPLVAAMLSICLGMDVLTWQKLLAAVLIFGGVALVNRSRARA